MITSAFLYISSSLLTFIVGLFPDSSGLPAEVQDSITTFAGYMGIIDPLVPVATLGTLVGLVFLYEITIFAYKGVRWAISHIPFIGGRG